MNNSPALCPCDSGKSYDDCCDPYHRGEKTAATAEALMRSRYSAYVYQHADYLLQTWHSSTRPAQLLFDKDNIQRWLGLKIKHTDAGGENDSKGTVEFVARFKLANGKAGRLHEISSFQREDGKWYYVDGKIH